MSHGMVALGAFELVEASWKPLTLKEAFSTVRDLNFELLTLCRRNRDGSFATRNQRKRELQLCATQLHMLGFRHLHSTNLKEKHVQALVDYWLKTNASVKTIQNRMSCIRWWADKVSRSRSINPRNAYYGIPSNYRSDQNKAQQLSESQFLSITDPLIRTSVRLQQAFGLRVEESIKFRPSYADKGDHIELKGSWTKGGRPRTIPILQSDQRDLIDMVHASVGTLSLIPKHLSYIQQRNRLSKSTYRAGFRNLHGLRHGYAQRRYRELTGWEPPANGGLKFKELTPEQQAEDLRCRLIVSRELGHNRINVTSVYLG